MVMIIAETDYDQALVRLLWNVWRRRPQMYLDSTGIMMENDIERTLRATGVQMEALAQLEVIPYVGVSVSFQSAEAYQVSATMSLETARALHVELTKLLEQER